MGYNTDPHIDEGGEALMDSYGVHSDRQPPHYTGNQFDIERGDEWRIELSPTPAPIENKLKYPRKRLVKKSAAESLSERSGNPAEQEFGGDELDDWNEEELVNKRMLSSGKKEKKLCVKKKRKVSPNDHKSDPEKSSVEHAMIVEDLMAEFEVTVEEDVELNRQNKPAINKLKKLSLLQEALSKKKLQLEFLDHGVLRLLKNWLEPLPDGSLPNQTLRAAILQLLSHFPIDLEQYDQREQLKMSGLGKVIMFLSRSDEECKANRKLAKELVDKWSRSIFNKRTRYEDPPSYEDERIPHRRTAPKRPANKSPEKELIDGDIDEFSQKKKLHETSLRERAFLLEPLPLDFVVHPPSNVNWEEVRTRAIRAAMKAKKDKMRQKRRLPFAPPVAQMRRPLFKVQSSTY